MTSIPSVPQVAALPCAGRTVVPQEYVDANGHMNIAPYMQIYNDHGWDYLGRFGLGPDDALAGTAMIFDVEHHLRYLREVHVGDTLASRVRFIARTDKAVQMMIYLVNETRDELAGTFESVSLHVAADTRRVAPFPKSIAERLDAQVAADNAIDWMSTSKLSLTRG
ncbi:MAG: thioesterase family protein [Mobilicoccus sp.]|nr:thioesterase family protein [Mobilicoccus sp.]